MVPLTTIVVSMNESPKDASQKEKVKFYPYQRNRAQNIELKFGDYVLVGQTKENRLSTPFSNCPHHSVFTRSLQ